MSTKFGTFKGVFIPSTEAILGTVLFLLMPLLVADVGLISMLILVVLAHTVTLSTTFSLSDCATNINRIEGGGLYALSKLSLGKAMGGSIGIMLYFAQAASIGFYAVGFTAALHGIIAPHLDFIPLFIENDPQSILLQKQILSTLFLLIFFAVVMAGADFTLKIQSLIMVILILSVLSIFAAPFFTELNYMGREVFLDEWNLKGNRPMSIALFFISFTKFFPAVTGISTGIGMSGDLKNPRKSIVQGTFLAIGFTMIIYLAVTFVFSKLDKNLIITGYNGDSAQGIILTQLLGLGEKFPDNILGLMILSGVVFATGSSALSVFMTGPRTAQFLAMDNILPRGFSFLKKDFRKDGQEPRFAILVSLFFALVIIWMGDINFAATVVGILFLVVYGWVNGAAFLERISKNPSFRPTFNNHWLISLYGFLACIFAICLFNWKVGIAVFLSQFLLFRLVQHFKTQGNLEGVWWGALYSIVNLSLKKLKSIAQGSRNWRPVVLSVAFPTEADEWKAIERLTSQIASYSAFVELFLLGDQKTFPLPDEPNSNIQQIQCNNSIADTVQLLLQTSQQAGIFSNTLLIQFHEKVDTARILKLALNLSKNILLYKSGEKGSNNHLDIWWRGERNGNLMALLAYIINRSRQDQRQSPLQIRVIRKLDKQDISENAENEMKNLFNNARISGEIIILPATDTHFLVDVKEVSMNSNLVMLGLPGNYTDRADRALFRLNEIFFNREIKRYDNLPPILFVKSTFSLDLTED